MTGNESFDDVLDALMIEEPEPSDEAVLRWSERYPQYRDELADFFATWATQRNRPEKEPDIDEDWIVQRSVSYAMEILRRQGRFISTDSFEWLGAFDQLVLAAVYLLDGKGYAVNISEKIREMSGKETLLGSIFVSLSRLENKGLVSSRRANPAAEPEAKSRRYFTVTLSGERALAHAKQTSNAVARFLEDFA